MKQGEGVGVGCSKVVKYLTKSFGKEAIVLSLSLFLALLSLSLLSPC